MRAREGAIVSYGTVRFSLALAAAAAALLLALALAPAAAAQGGAFGLKNLAMTFTEENGSATAQAGAHPYSMTTVLDVNTHVDPELGEIPNGAVKDLEIELPPGLVADPGAVPTCPAAVFLDSADTNDFSTEAVCPNETVVGKTSVVVGRVGGGEGTAAPLYNLDAPRGEVLKLGFIALGVPVTIEAGLAPTPPYNGVISVDNVSQAVNFYASETEVWGNPSDSSHDPLRGTCLDGATGESRGICSVGGSGRPFLTMPRSCDGALITTFRARSWQDPGAWVSESASAPALGDCASLPFGPTISSQLSTDRVSSPAGLAFDLRVPEAGIASPEGRGASDIERTTVTLPEGVTLNPSQAEGLETCSEAELARETPGSEFGAGCPAASKVGTVAATSPILEDETIEGQIYVATPFANLAGDSLIAVYLVVKDAGLGLNVVQPIEVAPDPDTGQLLATTEDMPRLPLSDVRLRLRSGGRSPLIAPEGCGRYVTEAELRPYSRPGVSQPASSALEISRGTDGGGCPPGGPPPFEPGFTAGTINNNAATYSPFSMRLTRADGEQDMTRFSAVLPPGVTARLAGLARCPDASIAAAAGRDGRDELARPSCPAASAIGRVVAGAGVGSQLTYVHGSLHLAGPYDSAPLSVVAIVPAVAGPFDVGTVVTRVGLRLNPITGQGEVDGAASDPIPHILAGIPLKVRDIRVLADRPGFTLNPTSCEPSATFATIWGGGAHPFSTADDRPFGIASRFQAASCGALGFSPKLAIRLKGGARRGAHPALRAVVTPKPGQANFDRAVVTLPRSAFLEQAHIRTICTRVQFAAGPGHGALCPPGARYGTARAWSPLLGAPAQGPVFLRSSDNNLPDLVVALRGPASAPVEVELSARIDSVRGGIRSTFAGIPDLPVSRFILAMQGGKKGLIVNSRHLCHKPKRNRAKANIRGQNGRFSKTKPRVVAVKCAKRRKAKRGKGRRARVARRAVVVP